MAGPATQSPPRRSRVMRALDELADRPKLATAREIAEALGITDLQVIWAMSRDGRFPAIRFGRTLRFDPAQVAAFLEAGGTPRSDDEEDSGA